MKFVKREEDSKSSDFSVQLITDKRSERVTKYSDKSSVKVKKMSAQIEKSNCRTGVGKLTNGDSFLVKGVCASDNKNTLCEEMSEIFTEYGVVAFQRSDTS